MNCDDKDPVIKEIPVYLAKELSDKLYIFQFPLRSSLDGYDKAKFLKVQVKPNKEEVQMDFTLDTNSEHYDTNVGENIAMNIKNSGKNDQEENKLYPSNYMDRIILKSTKAKPKSYNLAVGSYQDGELHLTTIKNVLEINPVIDYFDVNEKRSKNDSKNIGEDDDEDDTPKQVNVSFARNLPDHMKRMRMQSFVHKSQNVSEQFIEAQYHSATSSKAELTRLEMFCQSTEQNINNFSSVTKKQYMDLTTDVKQNNSNAIPNETAPHHILNLVDKPLLDHIRILLKSAKIMSFAQLRSIIPSEYSTDSVLRYLQQVAVLVQGNWIINSENEYPQDALSFHSGIPAELMRRARDYILVLFAELQYVDRRSISSVIKLPAEEIREILVNLATYQPDKGWHLRVPPNRHFINEYSELAKRQEAFWEAKKKNLRDSLKSQNHTSQRQRRKSNRDTVTNSTTH